MAYEPYLDQGLTSFQDVLDAFTKFKDGGYWVKKIVKKGGFHREVVEGPFKKDEAEAEANDWYNYFMFQDKITAEVFTFFTLCCDFELDENKKDYLYPEYIWQPPRGIDIFCLLYKPEKAIIKNIQDISDPNSRKFINYAKSNNINTIQVFDDLIFYNSKNFKSRIAARVLRKISIDYISLKKEKDILLEYVINNKLSNDFISIPDYITEFKRSCYNTYLGELKEIAEQKGNCNKKIKSLFDKLYKCLPQENFHLNEKDIQLNFYLLLSNRDYEAKIIKLIKHEYYDIVIGNEETFISITDINKCKANLRVNLPRDLKDFTDFFAQEDKKFQQLKNFLGLILYMAKCIGVEQITYNPDQRIKCICDNSGVLLYEEVINLLANKESIYKKVGFINTKEKELNTIINDNKKMTLGEILKIEKEDDEEEEDTFYDKTLEEIANLYLDGICMYEYGCQIMDEINKFIYPKIKDLMKYELKIKNKNLKFFRKMF